MPTGIEANGLGGAGVSADNHHDFAGSTDRMASISAAADSPFLVVKPDIKHMIEVISG